jgi:hypothetical protein
VLGAIQSLVSDPEKGSSLILKTPRGLATSSLVSSEESSVPHMAASPLSAMGHTTGTPGVRELRF